MGFIDLITRKKLLYQDMLDELKESHLENIFYGTSDAAKVFYTKFTNLKINIDTVMVSPSFYKKGLRFFNHTVENSSQVLNKIETKKNLIVFFWY